MKVVVTGGSGFVAWHLCVRLLHQGHEVTALQRTTRDVDGADRRGIRYVSGDVTDAEAVSRAVNGQQIVIHAAALVGSAPAAAHLALYGGTVPSLLFRIEPDPTVDFIVLGEPDETLAELMRGEAVPKIAGLLFREEGGWRRTPERRAEREFDRLPFPRWDLFPFERYVIPKSSTMGRMRFLPILTSRGCPFGRSYCPYPTGQGLKWRYRSPANVVDEIEYLAHDLGVEYVLFRAR